MFSNYLSKQLNSIFLSEYPIVERRILGRIFGPTKENQILRVKTNVELDKLIKHNNIINYIKAQRLIFSESMDILRPSKILVCTSLHGFITRKLIY